MAVSATGRGGRHPGPEGRSNESLDPTATVGFKRPEAERDRLLRAIVRVVGRKGYAATTVADVLSEAAIAPKRFESYFDDKQHCFLAAQDRLVGQAVDTVLRRKDETKPWLEQIIAELGAVFDICLSDRQIARVAMVEVGLVGASGRAQQLGTLARFAELIGPPPGEDGLPASTSLLAVSGAASLICDALADKDPMSLVGLLPELTFALLCPFIGPRAAKEEMARFVRSESS